MIMQKINYLYPKLLSPKNNDNDNELYHYYVEDLYFFILQDYCELGGALCP